MDSSNDLGSSQNFQGALVSKKKLKETPGELASYDLLMRRNTVYWINHVPI